MSGPIVATSNGRVEGMMRDGVAQFRGIPYASAPVGAARFLPPSDVEPWVGVRLATASRTAPPQLPPPSLLVLPEGFDALPNDEDCLELNVFTPATDGAGRPVMVWIHGGGFTIGQAGPHDGASLSARGDVVVVTVNYRLGALGFSHLDHLDERFAGSGNTGIRDQIAALRWVRDNIADFGGDPDCVTIFGESAGGHSVGCLLVSPEADGLFHRAIAHSSAGWGLRTPRWGEEVTARLMADLRATTIDDLQAAGVDAILAAQAGMPMRPPGGDSGTEGPRTMGVGTSPYAPTRDGVVILGDVIDEVASGRAAKVPLLLLHTRDELKLYSAIGALPDPGSDEALAGWMSSVVADGAAAVAAYRGAEPDATPAELLMSFLTDQNIQMPDFRMADVRVAHDPRVWMARLSWPSPADGGAFGACHGLDIPFIFWRQGQTGGFLGNHEVPVGLAHAMQDAWAGFARSGDPNCSSLPPWPRYDTADRAVMVLDSESGIVHDPDAAVRPLWEGVVL